MAALSRKVWDLIDPNTSKNEISQLVEPQAPKPAEVDPLKASFSDLNDNEKEEYRTLQHQYRCQLDVFDCREAALASIQTRIQETVSRMNLPYTFDCNAPYDMLVALKNRFAPTDEIRECELVQRYRKLLKAPHGQNLDNWLQQWERTYTECKKL